MTFRTAVAHEKQNRAKPVRLPRQRLSTVDQLEGMIAPYKGRSSHLQPPLERSLDARVERVETV